MSQTKIEATIKSFGGELVKLSHHSTATNSVMSVNVYLPASYSKNSNPASVPVLIYLSGLTCTPNNASEKAFWQPFADKYGFAVVFPDTSPRNLDLPGENDSWDFGSGAGFYVDSLTNDYKTNYNMYSYVHKELEPVLKSEFAGLNFDKVSITGHSMGGYGAISGFLKNPGKYCSVSAFAPILNPINCQWGQKNFTGYLGDDKSVWAQYDPTELIQSYDGPTPNILIHIGTNDPFYYRDHQLLPENFLDASKKSIYNSKVDLNFVEGFDHSYYFISSFVEKHAEHHAKYLGLI